MTKSELRRLFIEAFKETFIIRPKGKLQTIAREWDRVIWLSASVLVTITAFVTNNAGTLLLILWTGIVLVVGLYIFAKGK